MIQNPKKPALMIRLRENLVLGLLSLAPITVTLWVFISVVKTLDQTVAAFLPIDVSRIHGLGLVVTLGLLLLFGAMARTMSGKIMNSWTDAVLRKVPVVRGLYSVLRQMSNALFSSDAHSAFKRVVLVPFPHQGCQTIAFVTGRYSDSETLVFVPTSPNPTSGYVLIFKNTELAPCDLDIQKALQLVVSCGATTNGR